VPVIGHQAVAQQRQLMKLRVFRVRSHSNQYLLEQPCLPEANGEAQNMHPFKFIIYSGKIGEQTPRMVSGVR
jgi:hypothetical protein